MYKPNSEGPESEAVVLSQLTQIALKTFWEIFFPVIGAILIPFLLSFITSDTGTLVTGSTIEIQSQSYAVIEISNFKNEPIDGLMFSIPASVSPSEIIASAPVSVEVIDSIPNSSMTSQHITVSEIEPKTIIHLLIPVKSSTESIRVLNAAKFRVDVQEGAETPFVSMVIGTGLTIVWITIVLIFAAHFYLSQFKKSVAHISEQLDRAKKSMDEDKAEFREARDQAVAKLEKSDKRAEELENSLRKVQILLLARLSDYAKENTFWRDTIRKILYQSSHDEKNAERVLATVTESLKTYGTLEKTPEFETVRILAEMLVEREK